MVCHISSRFTVRVRVRYFIITFYAEINNRMLVYFISITQYYLISVTVCFKYSKLPDFGLCLLVDISGNCTRIGFDGGMSKTTFNTEATSPSIVCKEDNHSLKKSDLITVLRFKV